MSSRPGGPHEPGRPRSAGRAAHRDAARGGAPNGAGADGAAPGAQRRGIADQIRRYRGSFVAVVTMLALGVVVGGYVLANERFTLPAGFPVLGHRHFTLAAYFHTGQALTPGQGQAVTIAGAKMGEIESVKLQGGRALVTMELDPKYARYVYRNATLLIRPKTSLNDMTVEIDPGTPAAGRVASGAVIPISQTSPNVNIDQFLSALDSETRAYLQALLAAASEGLKGNGANLAAAYKRFDPLARNVEAITKELSRYHGNIARSIHNFTLLLQALAEIEKQLSELVVSANHVFRVFASKDRAVERTLALLPGALAKTQSGLGKLATAAHVLGPTLAALEPFAHELAPAQEATRPFLATTTPIVANEVRPFARESRSAIAKLAPASRQFAAALPKLTLSLQVLNELFNELAYNQGGGRGNFLFYADWAAHDVNSVYSTAEAHGALGNALAYVNCSFLPVIEAASRVSPLTHILTGLLNLPKCSSSSTAASATSAAASATGPRASATSAAASATGPRASATSAAASAARAGGGG